MTANGSETQTGAHQYLNFRKTNKVKSNEISTEKGRVWKTTGWMSHTLQIMQSISFLR